MANTIFHRPPGFVLCSIFLAFTGAKWNRCVCCKINNVRKSNYNVEHYSNPMKTITLILLFLLMSNVSRPQLIIIGGLPDGTEKLDMSFDIDTLSISNDSVFVVVRKYQSETLVFEEEQIFLKHQVVFHGLSRQWYENGKRKSEGKFRYGKKWGLWSYWDEDGNLSQDTDQKDQEIQFRGATDYIYLEGVKVKIRKDNE